MRPTLWNPTQRKTFNYQRVACDRAVGHVAEQIYLAFTEKDLRAALFALKNSIVVC